MVWVFLAPLPHLWKDSTTFPVTLPLPPPSPKQNQTNPPSLSAPCPSKLAHPLEELTNTWPPEAKPGLQNPCRNSCLGRSALPTAPSHLFQRFISPPLTVTPTKPRSTTQADAAREKERSRSPRPARDTPPQPRPSRPSAGDALLGLFRSGPFGASFRCSWPTPRG